MSEYGTYGSLHVRRIVTAPHGVFRAPRGAGLAAAAMSTLGALEARVARRREPTGARRRPPAGRAA